MEPVKVTYNGAVLNLVDRSPEAERIHQILRNA